MVVDTWPAGWLQSGLALGAVPVLLVLAWKGWGLSLEEIGLRRQRAGIEAGLGLGLGAVMAAASLLFLRFPLVLESPITYEPVRAADAAGLVQRVLVSMPLDTVLLEELAFRGVLLAGLLRTRAPVVAVVVNAGLFSAWHITINFQTVASTNLHESPLLFALGLIGAHLAIFGAGVVLAVLRMKSLTLAPCFAAHWGVNTGLLLGLFLGSR
ncbi:MAG: CPBP family intramembrane metalloprotease [Dehalococcoidia bacterium]|nr:CPBP family intramembrane metalloprotease [Dehalococcoidia bacterium]